MQVKSFSEVAVEAWHEEQAIAPSVMGSPMACEVPVVMGNQLCVSAVTPVALPELFEPRHPPKDTTSHSAPRRSMTIPFRAVVRSPIWQFGTERPHPSGIFVALPGSC